MKKILFFNFFFFLIASQTDINKEITKLQENINLLQKEVKYHQEELDEHITIIEAVEKKSTNLCVLPITGRTPIQYAQDKKKMLTKQFFHSLLKQNFKEIV